MEIEEEEEGKRCLNCDKVIEGDEFERDICTPCIDETLGISPMKQIGE